MAATIAGEADGSIMRGPIRILELRSVRGTGGGPEKTIMLGAAQSQPGDFEVTVCYIRDRRDAQYRLDERAAALGIEYVEVLERHSFDAGIWPQLRRLVRDRQIDVVHAHEYKTDILALLLAEREAVVPLATVHGWTGHSWRERHVYYPADRLLLRRYPRLIAVSGEIKRTLIAGGADAARIDVVLNGIDHLKFKRDRQREPLARTALGIEADAIVIGAVGRAEPQKRFDLLIAAFASILRQQPRARLVIAGAGSLLAALQQQAEAVLPPGTYRLLGHTDDVASVHHALDILVQSSEYEGTPNAVLEAMAFETPIVATDVGGTSELAHHREHALIVPFGPADALVEAVLDVIGDRDAAAARARAARRRIETELSFAARMRQVETIYRELVGAARQPAARRAGILRWV
jgi:glycosyltransferase involved in cell wall biosynthesis